MVDITGYGEVDLLAHPMSLACTTVARLQVIGGGHAHRRGWWLIPGAPAECFVPWGRTAVILLDPHPTPCLKSGKVAEAWRALGSHHPVQELIAIRPDLAGERCTLAGVLGQPRLVGPQAIAGIPLRRYRLLYPGGRHVAALVEDPLHGFQDALRAVQRADRRQDMGGIGPLRAPCLDPPSRVAG